MLKVMTRAVELGWIASRPTRDCRYDLILDEGSKLYRAQVKFCARKSSHSTGVAHLDLTKGGARNRAYLEDEIDAVVVYVAAIDLIVWLGRDIFHGRKQLHIRYKPTRSGQVQGTLMASEFAW